MDLSGIKRLLKCSYAFFFLILFIYKMVESSFQAGARAWDPGIRMPGGVGEEETRVDGGRGSGRRG